MHADRHKHFAKKCIGSLRYNAGCLLLSDPTFSQGDGIEVELKAIGFIYDERTSQWRAPGQSYRDIITKLHNHPKVQVQDAVRTYQKKAFPLQKSFVPRDHQQAALAAWQKAGGRGVVSLPTGAGKTFLAILAIAEIQRPTLVVVPTIDLLLQWQETLHAHFNLPIGGLGGGSKEVQDITVATYDSAVLMMDSISQKFGFIIFDECHHLPAPQYQNIALSSIAPFRLGLSATVERADGKESRIYELIGPMVFKAQINQMVARVLAPYDVVSIGVQLQPREREAYEQNRKTYVDFVRRQGIDFTSPGGWMEFVMRSARSPEGKAAMRAYRAQKKIAQVAGAKFSELWKILMQHKQESIIIFTDDNALAYKIGRDFVLPVITHQTKLKERKHVLAAFRSKELRVLVTAKVLNEGVDVPEASVAVIMSGSAGVREHVQRLGRILRHQPNKRAILYEIVAEKTSEQFVHKRRRMHDAYQESTAMQN